VQPLIASQMIMLRLAQLFVDRNLQMDKRRKGTDLLLSIDWLKTTCKIQFNILMQVNGVNQQMLVLNLKYKFKGARFFDIKMISVITKPPNWSEK
jgi:hypothetical protein